MFKRFAASAALLIGLVMGASAQAGPTMLTAIGEIENANRPAFKESNDRFIAYADLTFDKGYAFDLAALEALGMHSIEMNYAYDTSVRTTLSGPLLADVLDTVGATGKIAHLIGIDGYSWEFETATAREDGVLLVIKRDGNYIGVGDLGPIYVVDPSTPFEDGKQVNDSWVWGVYLINVKNESSN